MVGLLLFEKYLMYFITLVVQYRDNVSLSCLKFHLPTRAHELLPFSVF